MAQRSPTKSASMEDPILSKPMSPIQRVRPTNVPTSGSSEDGSKRTEHHSARQLIYGHSNGHRIQNVRVPHGGFQTKTTPRLHAKIVPQEIELNSVISEEDEGIMSTGGAMDEDGINQSVIYASSIRSVKRNLEDAPHSDVAMMQILNSYPPSSNSMVNIEEEKHEIVSPKPQEELDFIYVQHDENNNTIGDVTHITANFETYANNNQEPIIKEQFVTSGEGNTTESEEEQVIFYSEGLSNHATSYHPSGHDTADKVNHLTVIGSQLENGSIYQSQTSVPVYAECAAVVSGYCNDCAVSNGQQQTDAHTFYTMPKNGAPTPQPKQQRPIPLNNQQSNSTVCEGDTGGQKCSKTVSLQPRTKRQSVEVRVVCAHHASPDGKQLPLADIVRLENGRVHQRIRSTENTPKIVAPSMFKNSNEIMNQVQTRPRNDSSGGTNQSRQMRLEQLRNRALRPPQNNPHENNQIGMNTQSHPSERLMSPSSDLKRINLLTKSVEEEYSPKTLGTQGASSNSPGLGKHIDSITQEARIIFQFCQFLSRKDGKAQISKEDKEKQQLQDQTVQSYYNKSNNSTPTKVVSTSQAPISRYQQLFQYTVGTVASHQRYATKSASSSARESPSVTPQRQILLTNLSSSPSSKLKLNTPLRLDHIFHSILERTSSTKSAREVSMMRKLAIWSLCLTMMADREKLDCLPGELRKELLFFREEIENDNPFGGKVQLNPIPEIVKSMLKKDSNVINRMKTDTNVLESEKRIWTFPKFKPINAVVSITDALIHQEGSSNMSQTQHFSPSFGLAESTKLREADPHKFAEMFPDPHDYCIGVILQQDPPFKQPSGGKSDHVLSLDARIEQQLQNKSQRSGSQSPRWMQAQKQQQAAGGGPKKMIFPAGVHKKKTSIGINNSSRDTGGHTFDTMMEVPDEGMVDMKEFTDVDLMDNNNNQQTAPQGGHNSQHLPMLNSTSNGPQDYGIYSGPTSSMNHPAMDQTSMSHEFQQQQQQSKIQPTKKSGSIVRIGTGYGHKANVATNVKNNWQRSITTISKGNNTPGKLVNSSGKKMATTKLNYVAFSSLIQQTPRGGDQKSQSIERRYKDDQTKSSLSHRRAQQAKTSTSIGAGGAQKKRSVDKTQNKRQLIQRLALAQTKNSTNTSDRPRHEVKKATTSLNLSQGKVQSSRKQQANQVRQMANGLPAHHARSFAITTSSKPTNYVSFPKTSTTSIDSQTRRKQQQSQQQPQQQQQVLSVPTSRAVSPRGSANSNYRLTQRLPQSHRVKSGQSSQAAVNSQVAAQTTTKNGGVLQQPPQAASQKRGTAGQQQVTSTRAKTSLESHLMTRVMAPPQQPNLLAPQNHQYSQDIKNGLRQALLLSAVQQHSKRTSEAIKISTTMQQPLSQVTSSAVGTAPTTHRSPRRRLPQSFQSQNSKQQRMGGKTERQKAAKKVNSSRNSKIPRELSLSKSAQKIQEVLEKRTDTIQSKKRGRELEKLVESPKSSTSSFVFAEQDEFAVITQTVPSYKSKLIKKSTPGKAKINLNSQLHNKLFQSNVRVSSTPGAKVGGGQSTLSKNMMLGGSEDLHHSSTARGTEHKNNSSRQTSPSKKKSSIAQTSRNNPTSIKSGSFTKVNSQVGGSGSQRNNLGSTYRQNLLSQGALNLSTTPTPVKKHNLKQLLQSQISRSTSKVSSTSQSNSKQTIKTSQTHQRYLTHSTRQQHPYKGTITTQTSSMQRFSEGRDKEQSMTGQVPTSTATAKQQATVTKTFIQLL